MMEGGDGFFLVVVHEETAAAAEGENGNFGVGAAKRARWERQRAGRLGHVGEKRQANTGRGDAEAFEEFSAR